MVLFEMLQGIFASLISHFVCKQDKRKGLFHRFEIMHLVESYDDFLIVDLVNYSIDAIATITTMMLSVALKEAYNIAWAENPQLRLKFVGLLI